MTTAIGLLIGAAGLLLLWAGIKGGEPVNLLRNYSTGKKKLPTS